MLDSVARRAAVTTALFATTLLSAFFLYPTSHTSPTAHADTAASQPKPSDLPPELVKAVSRDLKITPEEYLRRATTAQQLQSYAAGFRTKNPTTFAGAYLTPDGKPTIAVTSPDAAKSAGRDGYQTRMAPMSAAALESSAGKLNQWIAGQPRDIAGSINAVGIDFLNSQLVVDIANTPIGHALNLPTLIAGTKVVLSPGGGGPVEHRPMGGDTYVTTAHDLRDANSVDICSFGFNSTDAAGNALNITAGHCNPDIDKGGHPKVFLPDVKNLPASPELGTFAHSQLGGAGGLDYSVIKLNDRAVHGGMDRPLVRGANGTSLTITGVATPVTGAPVCKSGQSSTFTCGYVMSDEVQTRLTTSAGRTETIRGFASSACTLGGDSGGAMVSGTSALGIVSGSNAAGAPNCDTANMSMLASGGTATLGVPIGPVLADIQSHPEGGLGRGVRVRTAPNA